MVIIKSYITWEVIHMSLIIGLIWISSQQSPPIWWWQNPLHRWFLIRLSTRKINLYLHFGSYLSVFGNSFNFCSLPSVFRNLFNLCSLYSIFENLFYPFSVFRIFVVFVLITQSLYWEHLYLHNTSGQWSKHNYIICYNTENEIHNIKV